MTGRELIIYILTNHLEDEPVFKDGKFIGFLTVSEVAVRTGVGPETVLAWIKLGVLPHFEIGNEIYIPMCGTTA